MFKAYKYRIYPTIARQEMLSKVFGCARFVYNLSFEPSSKTCNHCGKINKKLILKDREWVCVGCNTTYSRDVNAAINIKNFGLRNKPSTSQREALVCA